MTQVLGPALWLAALGQFWLLVVSVQIPTRLRWRTELALVGRDNRKFFLVAAGYVVLTYLSFAVLTLVLHNELVRGDRAALGLAAFIGGYWLVRLVLDWFWFGHADWPAGRRFVLAHIALELLFGYLVVVYLGVVVWHLAR